jgi:hypothetical protein
MGTNTGIMTAKLRAELTVALGAVVPDALASVGQKSCDVTAEECRRPTAMYRFQQQRLLPGLLANRNLLFGTITSGGPFAGHAIA